MDFQSIAEEIYNNVDKKPVRRLCAKIQKKLSYKSKTDLGNVADLVTWLYIYEYYDEMLKACSLLDPVEFTDNYDLWNCVDQTLCVKARYLRQSGCKDKAKEVIERVNKHRHPELYGNLVNWYRDTLNRNIASELEYSPKSLGEGWRMVKLQYAVCQREAGLDPIPDEEYERDIEEIISILKQKK